MFSYKAIYVIVMREFKRFFRQRGRLVTTMARPLIWLFLVGAGLTQIIDTGSSEGSYMQFILPGIVGMTILFSSIFSTISVVWDREFGFLREMLVAPISRLTIVVGKLLSGTVLSLFQGMAFSLTAFGLFIAARLDSLEGFNVIMNFIVLPMFFLSGALYPVSSLPTPLVYLTYINPLTYGIDTFKHVLLTGSGILSPEFPIALDLLVVILFAALMTALSANAFSKRG
jgi:ABC-2 type transport system permease protein